jgi:hypothetical protein
MYLLSEGVAGKEADQEYSRAVFGKIGEEGEIGSGLISKIGFKQYLSIENGELRS